MKSGKKLFVKTSLIVLSCLLCLNPGQAFAGDNQAASDIGTTGGILGGIASGLGTLLSWGFGAPLQVSILLHTGVLYSVARCDPPRSYTCTGDIDYDQLAPVVPLTAPTISDDILIPPANIPNANNFLEAEANIITYLRTLGITMNRLYTAFEDSSLTHEDLQRDYLLSTVIPDLLYWIDVADTEVNVLITALESQGLDYTLDSLDLAHFLSDVSQFGFPPEEQTIFTQLLASPGEIDTAQFIMFFPTYDQSSYSFVDDGLRRTSNLLSMSREFIQSLCVYPGGRPCYLIQDHDAPAHYTSWLSEGDKVAKYFDPETYCTTPVYPYKVHDVDILLYDFAHVGSVDLRIGVNLESLDSCDGPGTQIYLSDPVTVTTFYPAMAHIDLPDVVCVYEPFFIAVEWASGTPGSTPSFLMDAETLPCDTCHAWMWYDGYSPPWWEWNNWWTPPPPGCPIIRLYGFTESPACDVPPCDTTIQPLQGGTYPATVWRNPSHYGDRFPNERFLMPLDHGGRLEKFDIYFYLSGSTGTPDPDFYIWLSDGIYPLDNNPPYQAIAEFQIAYSDIVWYPGVTTVETYSHGLTFDPGEMFHIGFGHAYNPGDTLNVLSDGSNNSNRSIEWRLPGQWSTLLADWGMGVDFMINAYICPFAPEEPTFTMKCTPTLGYATPGDPATNLFQIQIEPVLNYSLPVTLSLLAVNPPQNITANFIPNGVAPPFVSAVEITVDPSVTYGDYTLTFQGAGADGQTKTCDVTLRVQPPYDEAMVQFYHGMQRATNFGAIGNDQQSPTKTKKHEFLEKTSKFQTALKQGNFVWYGTNYLFDGSFISAVPGTPQKDHMALDVYNCEHVGFIPTQHLVVSYNSLYNTNIAYANFYTKEDVISCEWDSLFIIGIMQVCVDFSIKIKIYYNPTFTPIPQLYDALYEDWDIGDYANNWVAMDTLHNLIYQWDVVDPSTVFGIFKVPFYDYPMFNMTAVSNPRFVEPNAGFCSAWGLDSLWWLMTRPGYYNTASSDTDLSLLAVPAPFALNPGEKHIEIWIDFGRNLNDGLTWETWWHKILRYVGFYRGDMNADNNADIGDVVYLINYLFKGGPGPLPYVDQGDVNSDRIVDIGDVVHLINYMFKNGAPPIDYVRYIEQFWSRPSLFTNPLWH